MIRAVLFDMDGTLVDSESISDDLLAGALGVDNLQLTQEQHKALVGTSLEGTVELLNQWYPGITTVEKLLAGWPRSTMNWMKLHGLPKKAGADEILHTLKAQGLKLAICTSNEPEVIECYLTLGGWLDLIDLVVTPRDVHRGKPAPDVFLHAAHLLGCRADECVGVEDSYNGVRAIRAAGMHSVMIPDTMPFSAQIAPCVDYCLNSLLMLKETIHEIDKE